jgi:hypothetical protein
MMQRPRKTRCAATCASRGCGQAGAAAPPKIVQPQPKGCPPGKSMAVINCQPFCK